MSYFAATATRTGNTWDAAQISLDGATDLDEVIDLLRDAEPDAEVSLLFVEAVDEYLVVMRLDDGDGLRVFGSDAPFADESKLGAILLSDVDTNVDDESSKFDDDEDHVPATSELDAAPVGDFDLLSDLGVPAELLLALCAKDGMLPSDVTAEVATLIGCGDVMEEAHDA